MCYNIEYGFERMLKQAIRAGASPDQIEELKAKLKALEELKREIPLAFKHVYLASGFQHPFVPVLYKDDDKTSVDIMQWGLIPHWAKNQETADSIWNKTINARGETIFEKPSFRNPAKYKRCVIFLDSFFENHHHVSGNIIPYNIRKKNKELMPVAGLWDEWVDISSGEIRRTFTIVTTIGSQMLTEIHNNPKLKEPRMPVLLDSKDISTWLKNSDKNVLDALIKPYDDDELVSYTVRKLSGKDSVGNTPFAIEQYDYPEFNTLF